MACDRTFQLYQNLRSISFEIPALTKQILTVKFFKCCGTNCSLESVNF